MLPLPAKDAPGSCQVLISHSIPYSSFTRGPSPIFYLVLPCTLPFLLVWFIFMSFGPSVVPCPGFLLPRSDTWEMVGKGTCSMCPNSCRSFSPYPCVSLSVQSWVCKAARPSKAQLASWPSHAWPRRLCHGLNKISTRSVWSSLGDSVNQIRTFWLRRFLWQSLSHWLQQASSLDNVHLSIKCLPTITWQVYRQPGGDHGQQEGQTPPLALSSKGLGGPVWPDLWGCSRLFKEAGHVLSDM